MPVREYDSCFECVFFLATKNRFDILYCYAMVYDNKCCVFELRQHNVASPNRKSFEIVNVTFLMCSARY